LNWQKKKDRNITVKRQWGKSTQKKKKKGEKEGRGEEKLTQGEKEEAVGVEKRRRG